VIVNCQQMLNLIVLSPGLMILTRVESVTTERTGLSLMFEGAF
jgi:hypothetical protein